MNTNWITITILYLWFLCGLYTVNRLNRILLEDKYNRSFYISVSFFIGPIILAWFYWLDHRKQIMQSLLNCVKKKPEVDLDYLNIVFLKDSTRNAGSGLVDNSTVLDFFKKVIYDALKLNSSDIFIDPKNEVYIIRFRVNGEFQVHGTLQGNMANSVISTIKQVSGLDIIEKQKSQEGTFRISLDSINTSFRVITMGIFGGEKIVIHRTATENAKRDLASLGFLPQQLPLIQSATKLQSGLILLCGPSGSGKTTTLNAFRDAFDFSVKNIVSIENPVERVIPQISQMEVDINTGNTYASLLKTAAHMNPDVICLGEIRDKETAEIAVQAAQTGHLVIATLGRNDNGIMIQSIDVGTRLRSIIRLTGWEMSLPVIASSLRLLVSQRLVRKLCPHCRKSARLTEEQLSFCSRNEIPVGSLFEPGGCPECDYTGYSGRQAIFDFLIMTKKLRAILEAPDTSIATVQQYIQENRQADNDIPSIAMDMLLHGEISLDEFQQVNNNC